MGQKSFRGNRGLDGGEWAGVERSRRWFRELIYVYHADGVVRVFEHRSSKRFDGDDGDVPPNGRAPRWYWSTSGCGAPLN